MCTIKVSVATDQQGSSLEQLNATDPKDKSSDELNEMVNRKNRNNPNGKGAKMPRTKYGAGNLELPSGEYATQESGAGEHFTDQNGVDLLQFFKITLNKNTKDRSMLLRIEKELASLAQDESYVLPIFHFFHFQFLLWNISICFFSVVDCFGAAGTLFDFRQCHRIIEC